MNASGDGDRPSPLGAVLRGVLAGVAGTAVMTLYQELAQRLQEEESGGDDSESGDGGSGDGKQDPWESAPVPAQFAKRVLEGVFHQPVSADRIDLLTNVVHWTFGTAWGGAFGLIQGTARRNPLANGLLFGVGVWGMSYVQLVPMGLYKPPWEYPAKTVALDVSYHVVYGVGVGAAYAAIDGDSG